MDTLGSSVAGSLVAQARIEFMGVRCRARRMSEHHAIGQEQGAKRRVRGPKCESVSVTPLTTMSCLT